MTSFAFALGMRVAAVARDPKPTHFRQVQSAFLLPHTLQDREARLVMARLPPRIAAAACEKRLPSARQVPRSVGNDAVGMVVNPVVLLLQLPNRPAERKLRLVLDSFPAGMQVPDLAVLLDLIPRDATDVPDAQTLQCRLCDCRAAGG